MAAMAATGIIHNTTDSIPTGFYRKFHRQPRKGELVIVTTPNNEFTRTRPIRRSLIKNLVAEEGDQVKIDKNGISVNGVRLEKSEPVPFLEPANVEKKLETGEIIIASGYNKLSYDSRYFGILTRDSIQCVVEPIYTWGSPNETFIGKDAQ
jgi:conjugative transfer signal peptidase TraF